MQKLLPLLTFFFLLTTIPVLADCDPGAEWKNHGQYVSCVAKTHPGGQVVSEAARSDVGKKNVGGASPSPSPEVSPSPSPEASPTPEVSPSPSPSPSPEGEATALGPAGADILQEIIDKLADLIDRLSQLFS